ncbi:M48 family metalloprotease [Lutimaribacter sp. EGI FJ00015]|uniref:M48 family metalloprotease n=1 Tax=Lutimaribacter degradans TaxID=2945989 RepID=A0ACC5ZSA2_9RHOB|nr:M48 family metalloprotease [Lutimaribacter sp. EGI FJ00013]MCM2561167.1 M48 family metalloprotease [Lutimaribacter sp. EGI FJ00013]MCO0611884.1 M48 family metalloprotease [Lutimaribacter sp. EGI FJ00015]MCO0634995.1 M48 family metalloprotease [Lutimaribacter sp. EGI FJ00014]
MTYMARLALTAILSLMIALPAQARGLVRDPDIEHALGQLAAPVLTAAGLSPSQVRILVIDDPSLNAFIVDNRHIFVNSGMLLKLDGPAQFQAIVAHEAAHIQNGHIARRLQSAQRANSVTGLGMALALAAAVSGADMRGVSGAAIGVAGSAQRIFMSHTRAEESSADAAAIRYMLRAGVDPRAFLDVLNIFRGQELLSRGRQDPYAVTHPLSRDRLRAISALVETADPIGGDPAPEAEYWFARALGKLSAFSRASTWTLRRVDRSATEDIRLMRSAIAHHRKPDTRRAIADIDRLVALRPRDPFVHELRGQILLESRQAGAAVAAYKRAGELAPGNALIMGGHGRALLAAGNASAARDVLERARARDFRDPRILRDLSVAYAKTGAPGQASVTTAERYALLGRFEDALLHAKRAEGLLPRGSRASLRAQDVISAAEAALNKRR